MRITGEHFEYLQRQLRRGYADTCGTNAKQRLLFIRIAIFNARDDVHMRQLTAEDPGVAQKLFRAEWYPYRIALHEPKNTDEG